MTMKDMSKFVQTKLEEMHVDKGIIDLAVNSLPHLTRWLGKRPVSGNHCEIQ
jgi:hypothetical protein